MIHKFKVTDVGVDVGLIIIGDEQLLKQELFPWKFDENLSRYLEIEPGAWICNYEMYVDWLGYTITGSKLLAAPTGKIIISDPCYLIESGGTWEDERDDWNEWIKAHFKEISVPGTINGFTGKEVQLRFKRPSPGTILLDKFGGDGCYEIDLTFTPLSDENNKWVDY